MSRAIAAPRVRCRRCRGSGTELRAGLISQCRRCKGTGRHRPRTLLGLLRRSTTSS